MANQLSVSDPQSVGGPLLRFDTEWNSNGKTKRRIRQVCDTNRQAVTVLANGNAAHHEQDYDFVEQLERIYETGFNEQLVGFSSREVKLSGGSLQSVTHSRNDGSRVGSVAVIDYEHLSLFFVHSSSKSKRKEDGSDDQPIRYNVVPSKRFAENEIGNNRKDDEGDALLQYLQLRHREHLRANPVGRYLKDILKQSDGPTYHN